MKNSNKDNSDKTLLTKMDLSPTAALVLDFSKGLYQENELLKRYVETLDLSSAEELVKDYKAEGLYDLACEQLVNRKYMVRESALKLISEIQAKQVVIIAAGLSPLGLEIAIQTESLQTNIYEVDLEFNAKAETLMKLFPQATKRIHFLIKDITAPDLVNSFPNYDSQQPTLIIIEGITHYLTPTVFDQLLQTFRNKGKNRLVVEYAPPFDQLNVKMKSKAELAYHIIEKRYHAIGMTKYTPGQLKKIIESEHGEWIQHFTMSEVEELRTGKNHFFNPGESGWVEVATAKI